MTHANLDLDSIKIMQGKKGEKKIKLTDFGGMKFIQKKLYF